MYDSVEYADSRLTGTIVRRDGIPVYIGSIKKSDKAIRVLYRPLNKLLRMSDWDTDILENFNLKPVPLGFCEVNGSWAYLSRIPKRRDWKQGIHSGNLYWGGVEGFDTTRYSEKVYNTIMGIYPSYNEAKVLAKDKRKTVAYHRYWAIDHNGLLTYKWDVVGTVESKSGGVVFNEGLEYLMSRYLEDLSKCK